MVTETLLFLSIRPTRSDDSTKSICLLSREGHPVPDRGVGDHLCTEIRQDLPAEDSSVIR